MKSFLSGLASSLRGTSAASSISNGLTDRMVVPEGDDAVLEIVGEASYQPQLLAVGGRPGPEGVPYPEQIAKLVREPANRYDRNAIAIQIRGHTVGYLSRDDAVRYQAVADWAAARGEQIACQARLTGGWNRGGGDRGSIGCLLHLGSPGETFLTLVADSAAVRTDHPWPAYMIAFTGDSRCSIAGVALDREASTILARRAGLHVHPRMTKKVQLLVDCDSHGESGNELKAIEYGVPVITEREFWGALGLVVDDVVDWGRRPEWQRGGR
jgi:hypothetical protein